MAVILHLVMGWLVLLVFSLIIAGLRPLSLRLLVAGGLFDTVGVFLDALDHGGIGAMVFGCGSSWQKASATILRYSFPSSGQAWIGLASSVPAS